VVNVLPLEHTTYVFIDGNYLRKVADNFMQEMFGVASELNFDAIRPGTNVRRVFYYDCLNDLRNNGESDAEFEARVAKQESVFNTIQSLRGFHVRLGSVTGSRRKLRQKKVDISLAVDAMEHAFRGNMSHVCLVSGDLDFAPLVDCLVRIGTYVEIMYERRSAATDLYRAADGSQEITFGSVYHWSTTDFRRRYPIPSGHCGGEFPSGYKSVKIGTANGKKVGLYKGSTDFLLAAEQFDPNKFTLFLQFAEPEFLEKYFRVAYGPLEWS
jgi:uncharacterized LabA/DUF88 family protein